MSHADIATLIIGCVVVILAAIFLAHWLVAHNYQLTANLRIARQNPPQPKTPKAEAVAPVTDIRQAS